MALRTAELTVEPATEPVTLAQFKEHAKIEDTFNDNILPGFITAARKAVEKNTKRSLVTQTWRLALESWPEVYEGERFRRIHLPHRPIQSATVTVDGDAVSTADYAVKGADLVVATTVDAPGDGITDEVAITYVAGYGDADDVPEDLKLAIKMLALHYFTGRGATSPQGIYHQVIPLGVESIIQPYVVLDI